MNVEALALAALMCPTPQQKCALTTALRARWRAGELSRSGLPATGRVEVPGRPPRPELVSPDQVPRRSPHTVPGRAALVHAVAHIEFNAIDLALDCVLRFSAEGDEFVTQWLSVASEEAHHFSLLCARLHALGYAYGDFTAHNGLWDMAVKTDDDFLARMALVPRLLEARGLDATPLIQAKLRQVGDTETLDILDIILRDEIGHVAIGDRWFRVECARRGLEPEMEFRRLIAHFGALPPRPPLNVEARLAAGFSPAELERFEDFRR
ncbi:ferritin-like domain-containing protein [Uliginosibacterium sp. H3]|uniref:Ferritin-like domain-containing protein n=1 Tax=Uliginosibacterium silvisoli TaxID=3114758 RepID=A0ABU6K6M6_9RHOO|nr:ferritin-like domain-containing protein [Uliginosibacterium sp. H3]